MLDYTTITRQYYAEWLDCDEDDFIGGVRYVCSPKRDVKLSGYSSPYALSIFKTNTAVVISYSSELQEQVSNMKKDLLTVESFNTDIDSYLKDHFPGKIGGSIKFVFNRQIPHYGENIVPLSRSDFDLFLNFRLSLGQSEWDGMREYFEEINDMGYCIAKMIDGKAVSMTDAPGMPFMGDMVQETGINTLPDYRNKGYAAEVVSAFISNVILDIKCPLWSCDVNNQASEKLAYSVGFKKFCNEYSIVL